MLAIRMPDGRMAFLTQPIPVTKEVAQAASEGPRSPESRFRFGSRCVQKACGQWTGSRCGIIDEVLDQSNPLNRLEDDGSEPELPRCGIRPSCRWFAQAGPAACGVCPDVITDRR
jgi:hypothetical protein